MTMTFHYSFDTLIRASEQSGEQVDYSLKADKEDLIQLAERLGVPGVDDFSATLSVRHATDRTGIEISGRVMSSLHQTCVVSAKDVAETVDDTFTLLLLSESEVEALDADEAYLDADAPEYDILEEDTVNLAEVAIQTLAVAMNPYPRAVNAEVDTGAAQGISIGADPIKKPNPFAVLEKLKDNS